jgi:hypothetical protein
LVLRNAQPPTVGNTSKLGKRKSVHRVPPILFHAIFIYMIKKSILKGAGVICGKSDRLNGTDVAQKTRGALR